MNRIWKVMQTLIEYYGFERDDSENKGNGVCVDTYVFENDFNDRQVIIRAEYDSKDMKIDEVWCEVINLETEETILDDYLDEYEIRNLPDYLDNLSKEYGIN